MHAGTGIVLEHYLEQKSFVDARIFRKIKHRGIHDIFPYVEIGIVEVA